ncbi:MAG: ABC-F family ATP-binding cassette domain-containing protein [Aureispira sp.]|nr:ABC-F family ATP-binding cassette domain-containing protein [Aureispira sp.]
MNFLTVENAAKAYGDRVLFDDVTFYINKGDRVAFIAKNGSGKTSLLNIITEKETADKGTVWVHHKITTGYLSQDPDLDPKDTVFEAVYNSPSPVMQAIAAYEASMLNLEDAEAMQEAMAAMDRLNAWDYEVRIKQILTKLKVDYFDRKIEMLSGGQKKRVALAKVLIEGPEFLILDEPTNHLDLEMIEWLEEFLVQGKHTIFMVTHDRYFLDAVCNQILELDAGQIFKYQGDYEYYLEKRADRQEILAATTEKAQNTYRKELEWMRRQPKARGTKAKARVDRFDDVEKKAKHRVDNSQVQLDIKMSRLGSKILELHNVSKSYGDLVLLDKFDYKFKKNDRVGIVGKNGSGKTTLLNMMTGSEQPDTGKVVVGDTLVIGYYTQSGLKIKADKRVIEVVRDVAEFIPMHGGKKLSAIQLCERFLFGAKKQLTYVSKLSGGERRRLHLLTILMQNPNFLILDEPTNDLDLMTLQVLEEFLISFPGCVLVVSHDRYFMDKIVDHVFVMEGEGKVRDFPGNYTDYRITADREAIEAKAAAKAVKNAQESTRKVVTKSNESYYEERKELRRVEKQVAKLEDKKKKVANEFNNPDLTPEQMTDLGKQLKAIDDELEEKEMRWMELVELLEG